MDASDEMKVQAWDALSHALQAQNGARPLFDFLRYPGNGMAKRASDELPEVQGWARLSKKCPLGVKARIAYDAEAEVEQFTPVPILELNGDDQDATQCQITLGSPLAIPKVFADLEGENLQSMGGAEFDNTAMSAFGNFPGTSDPITWPPLLYVIEWGIGGSRQTMHVDANNGARVNVTCSYLRVYGAVSPDAVNQPGTSGLYVLQAFVGPGWPTPTAAQRSICVGALNSQDESSIFPTPLHAKRVTVIGAGSPASGAVPPVTVCYVRFFADPNGTVPVGNYIVNGNQPGPFPVPNAGMYFSIVSGMVSGTPFAGVFELAS